MSPQRPTMMSHAIPSVLAFAVASLIAAAPLMAQASYFEGFNDLGAIDLSRPGPQVLVSRGWIFRNQSQPPATPAFFRGVLPSENSIYFSPQAGAQYLAANRWGTGPFGGTLSNWAILPAVANQQAGDLVGIWARSLTNDGQLEVRYSPSGGTSTGSSVADIGDFTTLLIDINPAPESGWTNFTAPVPGAGRIALRYRAVAEFGGFDPYVGMDSLSVGPPPSPPCNLPAVPQPGQTVTWTTAGSPYRVCQNITIPAGGTVIVQPGVVVNFDNGQQLGVAGTLDIQATSKSHAVFTAPTVFPPAVTVTGGTIDAHFTDFHTPLRVSSGANVLLSDCSFGSDALLNSDDIPSSLPYVQLERCTFTDSYFVLSGCLAVLRDNTFMNTYVLLLRTLADVTAPNAFVGDPLQIDRQESIQPLVVDGVHGTGSTGSGLVLNGGTYRLGPDTVLQGNFYPLELRGGLTPDSVVSATGNTNNAINVDNGGFAGRGRWPDLGLPYRLTGATTSSPGGHLTIDPGAAVEAANPDAALWFVSTRQGVFDGLPGSPITFCGLNNQSWGGLMFAVNSTTGCRMEYCVIEDAERGVISTDNHLYVDNCLFFDNQAGVNMNTFGSIFFRKTRFVANDVGVEVSDQGTARLNSPTNPNSFEGNGAAVNAFEPGSTADARNSWWNHPTGPRVASNPAGQGDRIIGPGAPGISYQPFRTAPPDFGNTPPVVRMVEPGLTQRYASPDYIIPDYLLDQGTRYILRWDVSSDDAVVSQRIEFSPDGHFQDRFTVIADAIPGDARSWEITIPDPGFAVTNQPQFLRVVSVDAAGQEAWDQAAVQVPSGRVNGTLTITSDDLDGQAFFGGTPIETLVEWSGSVDFGIVNPVIVLESDGAAILGLNAGGAAFFFGDYPFVSTDRARLALQVTNNSNDIAWFFADGYFSVRHDPRMGFVPPSVTIQSPQDGSSIAGGRVVPITWTAEAPEGLRSFDIQASYDAGRTWHPIVRDLSGAATSYGWRLPASAGIADVRIRVVVRDQRFQNSSSHTPSGGDLTIAITPGEGCLADFNDDGVVNSTDVGEFINSWFEDQVNGTLLTDWDGNGVVNSTDVSSFINTWFEDTAAGCG